MHKVPGQKHCRVEPYKELRFDLKIIESWIEPGSRVLGLGCGDGELLYSLKQNKKVAETGIEINESKIVQCLEKGLNVIHGDIEKEVYGYPDACFDYVILSQTIQQAYEPISLLKEVLRIGKAAVVSFPNFSFWKVRLQFLLHGSAPMTEQLPYTWYETPNIRVLSIRDFKDLAGKTGYKIVKETAIRTLHVDSYGKPVRFFPNARATYGIFLVKPA